MRLIIVKRVLLPAVADIETTSSSCICRVTWQVGCQVLAEHCPHAECISCFPHNKGQGMGRKGSQEPFIPALSCEHSAWCSGTQAAPSKFPAADLNSLENPSNLSVRILKAQVLLDMQTLKS